MTLERLEQRKQLYSRYKEVVKMIHIAKRSGLDTTALEEERNVLFSELRKVGQHET